MLAAAFAVAVGCAILFGWWIDSATLKSILPSFPSMPANSAVALVCCGVALLLVQRDRGISALVAGRALALTVVLFALLTLAEHTFALGWRLPDLIGHADGLRTRAPPPDAALSFLLIGGALLSLDAPPRHRIFPAELLALGATLGPMANLVGYIYGASAFYGWPVSLPTSGMALHTGVALIVLAAGVLAARPSRGLMALLRGDGPGSTMAQRVLVAAFALPLMAALAMLTGNLAGLPLSRLAFSLVILASALIAFGLLWGTAASLNASYRERLRAIAAAQESEARFRALISQASDGIFLADPDGVFLDVNESGCRMLGAAREELLGKSITDVLPPERHSQMAVMRAALLRGCSRVAESTLARKDGARLPVEISSTLLSDGRWLAFVRDISDRKRLEGDRERAYERERRLRRQIEAIDAANVKIAEASAAIDRAGLQTIFQTTVDQARRVADAQYAAMGVMPERNGESRFDSWVFSGVGSEVSKAIGREPRPVGVLGLAAARKETLRVRDLRDVPTFRGLPAGHPEMRSFLAVPICYRDRTVGILYLANKRGALQFSDEDVRSIEMLASRAGVAIAIARLRQVEATRRAWLELVLEQMPEAVLITDAKGRVLRCNRAALTLGSGPLPGADDSGYGCVLDIHSPSGDSLAWEDTPLARAVSSREPVASVELRIKTQAGQLVPVLASAAPIGRGVQDRASAVVVFQDITLLKELERQRDEWTSAIAHDLRQPLTAISLEADALRHVELQPDDAEAVETIRQSARKQRRLIEDLLDLSRLQAGRLPLERREVDLSELFSAVIAKAGYLVEGRDVRLETERAHISVRVDPLRIEQVLLNLLSNAAKYGYPGTPITVELEQRRDTVEVTVRNQGRGIPEEERGPLFSPFYRTPTVLADSAVTGLGLGLHICKRLVEAHGGRIWVESTVNRSTAFRFSLPLRDEHRPHSREPPPAYPPPSQRTGTQ